MPPSKNKGSEGCCASRLQAFFLNWNHARHAWKLSYYYKLLMVFNIIWVFISITLYFLGTYRGCSSPDSCGIFQDHKCAGRSFRMISWVSFGVAMLHVLQAGLTASLYVIIWRFSNYTHEQFQQKSRWFYIMGWCMKVFPWWHRILHILHFLAIVTFMTFLVGLGLCATLCEGIECKAIGRCKYYFAVCSGEPACEDIAASATNAFYDCGSDWNPAFETVADSDVCTLCGTVAAARRRMSLSVPDTEGASSRTEADLDFSDFLIKSLKLFRWSSGGDWRLQKGPRRMSDFLLKNETEREKERGWREAEWGGGGKMQVWIEEPEPEPEEGGDVWSRVLQDTTDNTTTTTTVAVEEDTGRTRVMRSAFYRYSSLFMLGNVCTWMVMTLIGVALKFIVKTEAFFFSPADSQEKWYWKFLRFLGPG